MSTAKTSAPVVGFNHNVKYGPRVYHVQTEDSGLPHAHYITHLFVGGNIVASAKTSYADKSAEAELAKTVRSLMEAQHKSMLKRLVSGEFNDLAERLAALHYEPGVLATGETGPAAVNTAPSAPASLGPAGGMTPSGGVRPVAPALAKPAAPPLKPAPAPALAAPAAPPAQRPGPPMMTPRPVAPVSPPVRAPTPPPMWQASPPGASNPPAPRLPGAPLPSTTRLPPLPPRPAAPPRMTPVVPPPAARPLPVAARPAHVGAPPRPATPSLFADPPVETPNEDLPTLFAEELISEKSLDEVILAFLSADLEPPR